jgi:hypothetical protein
MRRIILLLIVTCAIAAPASAQEKRYSGNDLIDACRVVANGGSATADNALQVGVCLGEIEALNWYAPGAYDKNLRACPPAGVTKQQMAKIIVDYLGARPQRRSEPFEGLALEAWAHTWPCLRGSVHRTFD